MEEPLGQNQAIAQPGVRTTQSQAIVLGPNTSRTTPAQRKPKSCKPLRKNSKIAVGTNLQQVPQPVQPTFFPPKCTVINPPIARPRPRNCACCGGIDPMSMNFIPNPSYHIPQALTNQYAFQAECQGITGTGLQQNKSSSTTPTTKRRRSTQRQVCVNEPLPQPTCFQFEKYRQSGPLNFMYEPATFSRAKQIARTQCCDPHKYAFKCGGTNSCPTPQYLELPSPPVLCCNKKVTKKVKQKLCADIARYWKEETQDPASLPPNENDCQEIGNEAQEFDCNQPQEEEEETASPVICHQTRTAKT